MMKRIFFVFFVLSLIFLSACSPKGSSTINPEVLVTATPPAQPESGKATVYGQVVHTEGYPMGNIIVRLADVARGAEGKGGAYILDVARSPGTVTDKNGFFSIQNVKAGEYVIVVGDVEATGTYEIISESNGAAKVWTLPADKVTNVDTLTVSIVLPTLNPTLPPGEYPAPLPYPYP